MIQRSLIVRCAVIALVIGQQVIAKYSDTDATKLYNFAKKRENWYYTFFEDHGKQAIVKENFDNNIKVLRTFASRPNLAGDDNQIKNFLNNVLLLNENLYSAVKTVRARYLPENAIRYDGEEGRNFYKINAHLVKTNAIKTLVVSLETQSTSVSKEFQKLKETKSGNEYQGDDKKILTAFNDFCDELLRGLISNVSQLSLESRTLAEITSNSQGAPALSQDKTSMSMKITSKSQVSQASSQVKASMPMKIDSRMPDAKGLALEKVFTTSTITSKGQGAQSPSVEKAPIKRDESNLAVQWPKKIGDLEPLVTKDTKEILPQFKKIKEAALALVFFIHNKDKVGHETEAKRASLNTLLSELKTMQKTKLEKKFFFAKKKALAKQVDEFLMEVIQHIQKNIN